MLWISSQSEMYNVNKMLTYEKEKLSQRGALSLIPQLFTVIHAIAY